MGCIGENSLLRVIGLVVIITVFCTSQCYSLIYENMQL